MTITWQSEQAKRARFLADAYDQGVKTGRLDRSIGVVSEYALNSRHDGGYPGAYGTGYRAGLYDLAPDNPWR